MGYWSLIFFVDFFLFVCSFCLFVLFVVVGYHDVLLEHVALSLFLLILTLSLSLALYIYISGCLSEINFYHRFAIVVSTPLIVSMGIPLFYYLPKVYLVRLYICIILRIYIERDGVSLGFVFIFLVFVFFFCFSNQPHKQL